jgi:ferredoxin-NADP reductase
MEMEPGEEATIFGPTGKFVINWDVKNIVFLISGIGITPVVPMLKELEENQFTGKVFLIYSNKTKNSTAYDDELKNIKLTNYNYLPIITSETKRIDSELLKRHLKDLNNYEYYLVGTTPFLKAMKLILMNEGVDLTKLNEDDFG